jgi:hypothetical protein
MDRCIETFPLARFRDLMGVPPGKLTRGPDFTRFVIDPAVLEVSGISDMSVKLELQRHNKTRAIEAVTVAWWHKEGDELRAAMRERDQSKIGRMVGSLAQRYVKRHGPAPSLPVSNLSCLIRRR